VWVVFVVSVSWWITGCASTPPQTEFSDPLETLVEGNKRFHTGHQQHPHEEMRLRQKLQADGQHPFATIVACSDSRVPVELLFDQGVGDLFVIRVAGNVVGRDETASIEYAVAHLQCPLVVILGHRYCGAVTAATQDVDDTPNVEGLLSCIAPAVERTQQLSFVDREIFIDEAVKQNILEGMTDLIDQSAVCRCALRAGELRIVGALYHIGTGEVEWLGEHPYQSDLLAKHEDTPARHAAHPAAGGGTAEVTQASH
jgi:carbonic anhydrase